MKPFYRIILAMFLIALCCTGCSRDSNKTAEELNDKAMTLLLRQNRTSEALKTITLALKKAEKEYGPEHQTTVACLATMALIYQSNGDSKKAESPYKRALSIMTKINGKGSVEGAKIINNLAAVAYMRGDYSRAADFYKKCLAIAKKKFPAGDERILVIEKNLKQCTGQHEEKVQNNSGQVKPVANIGTIPDLVPGQIKKYVIENLAKQNVYLSDFKPLPMLKIGNKGAVFPYVCLRRHEEDGESIKIVVLFAAAQDKTDKTKYIFQQTRLVSFKAYKDKLSEGGIPLLQKEMANLFPRIFS